MYILYLIRYIRMTSLLSENFVTLNKFDPALISVKNGSKPLKECMGLQAVAITLSRSYIV